MFNNKDLNKISKDLTHQLKSFEFEKYNNQKIISVCTDIGHIQTISTENVDLSNSPIFFKSNNILLYGFIKEYQFSFTSCVDYFSRKNKMLKILSNTLFVNKSSNSKTYIFGGENFDLEEKNYDFWKNIPIAQFILPRYIITKEKFIINLYLKDSNSLKNILSLFEKYINDIISIFKNCIPIKNESTFVNVNNLESENKYHDKLNESIKTLKKNDNPITKVVFSRIKKVSYTDFVPIINIYENLLSKNEESMNFLFSFNKHLSLIGSTPELILSKTSKIIQSESLAGSNFDRHKNEFRSDSKEINEQRIVTDYILDFFENNANNINYNDIPDIKKSSNIDHLCTSFCAQLKNNNNILDLLNEIHPTPAIAGYPKQKALEIIRSYKENRGWYGGPIGWIDNNLDGKFYLNIRSGVSISRDLYLFSGSGITEKSISKNEWKETEHKFKLMLNSL